MTRSCRSHVQVLSMIHSSAHHDPQLPCRSLQWIMTLTGQCLERCSGLAKPWRLALIEQYQSSQCTHWANGFKPWRPQIICFGMLWFWWSPVSCSLGSRIHYFIWMALPYHWLEHELPLKLSVKTCKNNEMLWGCKIALSEFLNPHGSYQSWRQQTWKQSVVWGKGLDRCHLPSPRPHPISFDFLIVEVEWLS